MWVIYDQIYASRKTAVILFTLDNGNLNFLDDLSSNLLTPKW